MEDLFRELLVNVGEDPDRQGLKDTPKRMVASYRYLTQGYRQNIDDIINEALFDAPSDEMIIVKDIELYSLCEHHMLPFIGKCHVGYIPKKHVLGLSKVARLVDLYARRLQLQERLTQQVAEAVMGGVEAQGVGVVVEAKHLCMMMRGVGKQNSVMTTSCMLGSFRRDARTRSEFLSHLDS